MSIRQAWRARSLAEWREEFIYRAAVIEYEGCLNRPEAERIALEIVGPYTREMDRENKQNPRRR